MGFIRVQDKQGAKRNNLYTLIMIWA